MAALWTRSWGTTIQVSGHLQVIYAHFMRPILLEYWCRGNEKGKEKQKKNKSAEKTLQPKQDISSAQTLLQPGSPRRGSVPTVHALNKRLKGKMKAHSHTYPLLTSLIRPNPRNYTLHWTIRCDRNPLTPRWLPSLKGRQYLFKSSGLTTVPIRSTLGKRGRLLICYWGKITNWMWTSYRLMKM